MQLSWKFLRISSAPHDVTWGNMCCNPETSFRKEHRNRSAEPVLAQLWGKMRGVDRCGFGMWRQNWDMPRSEWGYVQTQRPIALVKLMPPVVLHWYVKAEPGMPCGVSLCAQYSGASLRGKESFHILGWKWFPCGWLWACTGWSADIPERRINLQKHVWPYRLFYFFKQGWDS